MHFLTQGSYCVSPPKVYFSSGLFPLENVQPVVVNLNSQVPTTIYIMQWVALLMITLCISLMNHFRIIIMLPNQKLPISAEKKKLAFRWPGLNLLMKDIFFNGDRLEAEPELGSRPDEEYTVRGTIHKERQIIKDKK